MLTPSQIRWAADHDWFIRDNKNGTITVLDAWLDTKTNEFHEDILTFCGSFLELRAWAGY